jgi:hypothetical protein
VSVSRECKGQCRTEMSSARQSEDDAKCGRTSTQLGKYLIMVVVAVANCLSYLKRRVTVSVESGAAYRRDDLTALLPVLEAGIGVF